MKKLSIIYSVYRPIYERMKKEGKSSDAIIDELVCVLSSDSPKSDFGYIESIAEKMLNYFNDEVVVIDMFVKGLTQTDVREQTGLDANKIRRIAKYAKSIGVKVPICCVNRPSRGGLMSKKEEVVRMFKEGKSNTEIASALGIFKGNVSQYRNKLRRKEIEEFGTTSIPSGKDVASEVVYTRPQGRPTNKISESSEHIIRVLGLSEYEAKEYEDKMSKLSDDEKKQLSIELEVFCNEQINNDVPLDVIYKKYHNKDWYAKVNLTMPFLEELAYGYSLDYIKRTQDLPDMRYYLDGDNICYDYDDCVDKDGKSYTKRFSRKITKQVADMILDEAGEPRKLMYEGRMCALNTFIVTGRWDKISKNTFIRRIKCSDELVNKLKEVAAA